MQVYGDERDLAEVAGGLADLFTTLDAPAAAAEAPLQLRITCNEAKDETKDVLLLTLFFGTLRQAALAFT